MAGTEAIFFQLTILLVLATLSHFTIKRFHQPTIVGEIALGILLGPSILGFYFGVFLFDTTTLVPTFASLGAIFLLFLIGLESDFRLIYTRKNVLVASGGVVLPLVVGLVIAYFLVPTVDGVGDNGTQFAMAVTFLYAFVAEVIGLSAVVGAFLAGSLFSTTPLRDDFTEGAGYLGAVFTPIFFISLGLQANLPLAGGSSALLIFGAVLTVAAILTKVAGCGIPARLLRMTRHESESVGWGVTPPGQVGLVVPLSAFTAGGIKESLFSIIVVVMIFVSILPAPLFKRSLAAVDADRRRAKEASSAAPP